MNYNLVDAKDYVVAVANDHINVTKDHDDAMHGIPCAHNYKKVSF